MNEGWPGKEDLAKEMTFEQKPKILHRFVEKVSSLRGQQVQRSWDSSSGQLWIIPCGCNWRQYGMGLELVGSEGGGDALWVMEGSSCGSKQYSQMPDIGNTFFFFLICLTYFVHLMFLIWNYWFVCMCSICMCAHVFVWMWLPTWVCMEARDCCWNVFVNCFPT